MDNVGDISGEIDLEKLEGIPRPIRDSSPVPLVNGATHTFGASWRTLPPFATTPRPHSPRLFYLCCGGSASSYPRKGEENRICERV